MRRTYKQFICLLKRHGATEEQYRRNRRADQAFDPQFRYYVNLDRAFSWGCTPEGYEFWRLIASKIYEWDNNHDQRD